EVTRQKVRRERMGHIELAAPVSHIWFFKGVPSRIGYLLDIAPKDLEKVLYFAASIITSVDEKARAKDLKGLKAKVNAEIERIAADREEMLGMVQTRLERRRAYLAEGVKTGFDEDDNVWMESIESWAEEQSAPALKDVRKIGGGVYADIVAALQGTEDRKTILTVIKESKFRPDRRLSREQTVAVKEWGQYLVKSMKDADEKARERRLKYIRSAKGAMAGFTEEDRTWVTEVERQVFQEMPWEVARTTGAHLIGDVVEHAPGPEPKKITDTMSEYALREGGAVTKDENDLLLQWAVKTKETAQDLASRMSDIREGAAIESDRLERAWALFEGLETRMIVADEPLFRELKDRFGTPAPFGFGEYFEGGMGANAMRELLRQVDPKATADVLREEIRTGKGQKQQKAIKRLKVVNSFVKSDNQAEWMILDVIPVIPPELRPMVQLDGGRFATSDLNDLYRRVINRNNRLKRLLDLGAPEIIVNNEKRMLQEAVDALFDNGRRGRAVTGPGNRPLKSLSDMLKGKQGRFRQNLLGKRVDYSGRSVIVAGPSLKLHQCGLPKLMALELFKPFIMARLVERKSVQNIKAAKKMVESQIPEVWDVLEEVISEHPVLLNRAPTLHRLGIQAFEPKLVEGKAIQVHPLVCSAFNADFDGDQMAVHLPLSAEAQAEARILMLSAHNILSPAHGNPLAVPSQDMVLGLYYLTWSTDERVGKSWEELVKADKKGEGLPQRFGNAEEVQHALTNGQVQLRDVVAVRLDRHRDTELIREWVVTTPGRLLFHDALERRLGEALDVFDSADHRFMNETLTKKQITIYVNQLIDQWGTSTVALLLDTIKDLGFEYAEKSGGTVSKNDIIIPDEKWEIIGETDEKANLIRKQYERGLITEGERKDRVVSLWETTTEAVAKVMGEKLELDPTNPIFMMADSGARGSTKQLSQLAGMRGLMANPKGETIDQPIRSNFMEGLTVLEFFTSTHGARKGLADTALRTADSGYLTRRLVDVAQDVIVRTRDCGTSSYITLPLFNDDEMTDFNVNALGRVLAEPLVDKNGEIVADAGDELNHHVLRRYVAIHAGKPPKNRPFATLRSVLYCEAEHGMCQACYGRSLADGRMAELGDVAGIIAAQSIGEPGTQLTMRTFHTGGVAGGDITTGLPRVVEIFEARNPKGAAELFDPEDELVSAYEAGGVVHLEQLERSTKVTIKPKKAPKAWDEADNWVIEIERGRRIIVEDGSDTEIGLPLTEGSQNPADLLRLRGAYECASYLVAEVQRVYQSQGVEIHDKHLELIIRQMLKKVRVITAGGSELWLPGELADGHKVLRENLRMGKLKTKAQIEFEPVILGITKASLATDSFLSAASFQETTKVLTDAALEGRVDNLVGLKENVIIGKLIPAATGLSRYQDLTFGPAERPRTFYEAEQFLSGLDLGTSDDDRVGVSVPNPDLDNPFGL
ncbi:MAG: DNA-directed polymerase subunit beta, partial [Thermoleophilia bacterium]|nr:DNA-directed polymerase subunit beta [Thermoleophilia bacterium]